MTDFRTGVLVLYIVVGQARTHPMSPSFSLPEMEFMQTILQIMIFVCLFIGTVCIFDDNKTKYRYALHTYNKEILTTSVCNLYTREFFSTISIEYLVFTWKWYKTNKFSHLKFTEIEIQMKKIIHVVEESLRKCT